MKIDVNSATVQVDIEGSKPGTTISPDGTKAALHLTRHVDAFLNPAHADSEDVEEAGSAISLTGRVDVHLAKSETIAGSTFGFLQFAVTGNDYLCYAGQNLQGGSVSLERASPPLMPKEFAYQPLLDSFPGRLPFYTAADKVVVFPKRTRKGDLVPGMSTIVVTLNDHPISWFPVQRLNRKTNKTNFLAEAFKLLVFNTGFVVRDDKTKQFTTLVHLSWIVYCRAKYHWLAGKCIAYPATGSFDVTKPTIGAPTNSAISGLFANPPNDPDKIANAVGKLVAKTMEDKLPRSNLAFSDRWPPDLPTDFWTD